MSIQDIKDFWNKRPCNIYHSNKTLGSKEYFDEVEKKKYRVEPHIPKFAEFAKYKGKKVLELGCGIGTDSIQFVQHGADLTIVELSENSLDLCKKRFKVYDLQANFYLGNIEELTLFLPVQKFDLIYSFGVIHHTVCPENVIKEIVQYMDEDTELKFMVYSKFSYKLFHIMHYDNCWNLANMDNIIRVNSEAQYGSPFTYTFTFEEIKELLNKYDIVVKKIYKDHIFRYKISEYKNHQYVLEDCFQNMDEKLYQQMCKELGWHTMVIAQKKNLL